MGGSASNGPSTAWTVAYVGVRLQIGARDGFGALRAAGDGHGLGGGPSAADGGCYVALADWKGGWGGCRRIINKVFENLLAA